MDGTLSLCQLKISHGSDNICRCPRNHAEKRKEKGELRGWLQWLVSIVVSCFREGGVHHIQATVQYVSSITVAAYGSGIEPCPHSSPREYFVPSTRP